MKIMVAPRGAGKSNYILRWLEAAPSGVTRVVIHPTVSMAHNQRDAARYRGLNLDDHQFIGIKQVDRLMGLKNVEVAIDNLDLLLDYLIGHKTSVATTTGEFGNDWY